ncbi:MAG: RidA family protein [Armatimonadota bacterium]
MKQQIQASTVPKPGAAYSQGILAEGSQLLYISGQVPVDENGELVGAGDMKAQARQVFENLQAQLCAAGADFSHLVKLTIFVTDMDRFGEFSEVRSEYLRPPFPAASAVKVAGLVDSNWLVEVEAYAVVE